ncbi:MAG: ABC transporter permease [Solirubrobacteraceae bacterium]
MSAVVVTPRVGERLRAFERDHPVARLVIVRVLVAVLTLWLVSVVIFAATQALPGNAAYAVLGRSATPARLHAFERLLHLNRPLVDQYGSWIGGVLRGDFGTSLANNESVWALIGPRLLNSAVLVALSGLLSIVISVSLGILTAAKRDTWLDHASSVVALAVIALPEFVVALGLVIVLAVLVLHVLPAVSAIPPGSYPWQNLNEMILPVATLVIVIGPYMFRITRGAMIDALESDHVEMARLKGLSPRRVLLMHAFPSAIPPVIQVIGLSLLYLAGGIVVVEYVFDYPGVGAALVDAVSNRDIPTIQFVVLILATFYVVVNITTDVIALLASPRRRAAR